MTDSKYSPLDHGGLEAVERTDGMEVVPNSAFPPDRKSTMLNPEPVPAQSQTKEEYGNYYHSDTPSDITQTPYSDLGKPAYFNTEAGEVGDQIHQSQKRQNGRRYCGMRKAIFIALVVAVILLICVAAVLGGVLGVLLPKKDSENSAQALNDDDRNITSTPLQTMQKTGIASTIAADDNNRLLVYYQAEDGRIIENSYLNDRWSLDDHAMVDASVVTRDADAASPLAAVSYENGGKLFRQVFFITDHGDIMSTHSSSVSNGIATSWSTPEKIIDGTFMAGSPALAACTGPGLNGIQVYYSSQKGYINEVRYRFDSGGWTEGGYIDGSDPMAGVACSVYNNPPDYQIVNVYYRDKVTKRLRQSYVDFDDTTFSLGPIAPLSANQTLADNSDIAVCTDDTATEYVFFQARGGTLTKSTLGPEEDSFSNFKALKASAAGTKFAVAFLDGEASGSGAAVTFQPGGETDSMWLSLWSRSDAMLVDVAVT